MRSKQEAGNGGVSTLASDGEWITCTCRANEEFPFGCHTNLIVRRFFPPSRPTAAVLCPDKTGLLCSLSTTQVLPGCPSCHSRRACFANHSSSANAPIRHRNR